MKLPKLKYYYMALNEPDYRKFETTRQLLVNQAATINVLTGQVVQSQPFHYLYAQPTVADTRYRQLKNHTQAVYVLRIPASIIPRKQLETTTDPAGMWLCRADLAIQHCGVELFELAPAEGEIVATSKRK